MGFTVNFPIVNLFVFIPQVQVTSIIIVATNPDKFMMLLPYNHMFAMQAVFLRNASKVYMESQALRSLQNLLDEITLFWVATLK